MKPRIHLVTLAVLAGLALQGLASPPTNSLPTPIARTPAFVPPDPAPIPKAPPSPKTPPPKGSRPPAKPTKVPQKNTGSPSASILSQQERDAQLRLQIFLDTALFSPGKLDAQPGALTTQALSLYQKAHGLEITGRPDNVPIDPNAEIYTTYTIRPEDAKFVGDAPTKPEEQSKKRYLPYGSFLELITERYHVAEGLLARLNPTLKLDALVVGDTLKVPNVEPFLIEDVHETGSVPLKPEFSKRRIRVDRKGHVLELWEGEQILASVPITAGSAELPTPPGKWRILGISLLPTFRWDEGVLNHGVRTSHFYNLPSGPNNPVGVAWCALNKPGIGIHGTNHPETIGRAFSHGCMRVANWDIIRLVNMITADIPVLIE